ncbi:MAG: hypothetical protein AAFP99_09505 [Pseudomonadota bacterium]
MIRRKPSFATGFVALMLLAGCQTSGDNLGISTNSAGIGDASAGLLTALNGGLVGQIGAVELRGGDQSQALASEYRALEYAAPGDLVTWIAGSQPIKGEITASQPYRVGSQDCRQYTHQIFNTALPAGQSQPATARGTACRNEDGSWSLLT